MMCHKTQSQKTTLRMTHWAGGRKWHQGEHTQCDEHLNPQEKKKKEEKCWSVLSALYMHRQSITHTHTHTWHSPTPLSPFSPLAHCQHSAFLSPHASLTPSCWERQGGALGCHLEDRHETAKYKSVLIAPFIDSCLSNCSKRETLQRVPLSWVAVQRARLCGWKDVWRAQSCGWVAPQKDSWQSCLLRLSVEPRGSEHRAGPVWAVFF